MKLDKESSIFMLQTVSPLHIGCDEAYEPTGFVIDEKKGCLVVFDSLDFIGNLNSEDRRQFSDICRRGTIESIIEIYRFLRNRHAEGRNVQLAEEFIGHYRSVLKLPRQRIKSEINRFEIQRTSYRPSDQRPYIPGSAVKGAMRTAVLNVLAQTPKLPRFKGKKSHQELEENLLNLSAVPPKERMSKDPFRLVKVSDFMPAGDINARVVYAVNRKKSSPGEDARGPYQILEVVLPGSIFTGRITVEKPQRSDAVSLAFSLDQLLDSCRRFYGSEQKRESREFSTMGITHVDKNRDGPFLLRIGRHSGAECVTIGGHRDIKIMQNRGSKFLNHATTVWLTSESSKPWEIKGLAPFGWATLKPLDAPGAREMAAVEEDYRKLLSGKREHHRQAARKRQAEEHARREREQKKQEAEAFAKAQEAERKARLEAMSPEERMIEEVKSPAVIENRVVEIYNQLDEFPAQYKIQLAQALRAYWMAAGKWKKKKCTAKQWKKVQHVKSVLGE